MTRERRAVLAVMLLFAVMGIIVFFDPVMAIDALVMFIVFLIYFKLISKWWHNPTLQPIRAVVIVGGPLLYWIVALLVYMPVPLMCSLVVCNGSSYQGSLRLREIVIALHRYHEEHGKFPDVTSYSKTGQPLLSWRVHLLPFLGREELYRRFRHDEPWDSENNLALLKSIPDCYRLPGYGQQVSGGGTYYQLIVGPGAVFEPGKQVTLAEIAARQRLDSVIIAGIAQDAVPWTKPGDLVFEENKPLALGRVVRNYPATTLTLVQGMLNKEPGEGNRHYYLAFADGHLGSLYTKDSMAKLSPFIKWRGPKPVELENLR